MEDNQSEGVKTIYLALGERFVGAILNINEKTWGTVLSSLSTGEPSPDSLFNKVS